MIDGFMFLVIEFKLGVARDQALAQLFLELLCVYFLVSYYRHIHDD
jgi:hypothetical protein